MKNNLDLLTHVLECIDSGITVQNEKGEIIYANPMAATMTGTGSVTRLLQIPTVDVLKNFIIYDNKNRELDQRKLPSRLALKGKKPAPLVVQYKKADNTEKRWVYIKSVPIFDKNKKVKFVVNIFQDITRRKDEEESMNHFIAAASHELKTPLAGVKALNQLIEKNFQEKQFKIIPSLTTKIDEKVNILTKIINDFLDTTKIRAGKLDFNPEIFDFDNLVEDIIEDFRSFFKKHLILKQGCTKKIIVGDRFQIQQVIENLLRNANKYSPDGTKIVVKLTSTKKNVKLVVQDFGDGINEAELKRIFEPYYRSEKQYTGNKGGLGLGLYISAHIIELHGGKIGVKSKVGKGSAFYFSLPIKLKLNSMQKYF